MAESADVPAIPAAEDHRITLDQGELDQLLLLNGFLKEETGGAGKKSLIDEIEDAVLDSGKLSLKEWMALRDRLKEIERLVPHIDLIIQLKSQRRRPVTTASPAERLRPLPGG